MKTSNRFTFFRLLLTPLLVISMALVCGTVTGQDAAEDEEAFVLEDIVVTAEFREKELQKTPLSITAVNAEMIESRNQVSLDQIAAQAPGVTLKPNSASMGSSLVAFIRGIGQTDFNPSVEPGVAIYVDDVYYATITGNLLDLLDLERVEILRGPQGTLAGRNAIGGAIKLFTRQADGRDDGFLSMTTGSYDRLDFKGAAGFTIVPDKLFVRLAGVSRSRDGYIQRLDYACANNLPAAGEPGGLPRYSIYGADCKLGTEGGQSMTAGRVSLRWLASDNFEVNFSASFVNDKSEAQPNVLVEAGDNSGSFIPVISGPEGPVPSPAFNPNSSVFVPIFYDNNGNGIFDLGIDVPHDNRFATGGTYHNYSTYINDGTSTPSIYYQNNNVYVPDIIPPINHFESNDYTLSLKFRLSDTISLLSVSSYREYTNTFGDDNDGSPLCVQQLLQRMIHDQFTQELRLNAALADGFADLTVGAFYLDKETNEDARVDLGYIGLNFIHGPDLVPSKSKALYSQVALHLSDRSDLSLGVRYSEDEKSYTFGRHNPDGTLPIGPTITMIGNFEAGNPPNAGVYGVNGLNISYESDRLDYRAAIDYDVNDDIMVYAQIATGYKAGGNNARPFTPNQLRETDPEELISYEIGAKTLLFDQLRLNGAVFSNEYTDLQLLVGVCSWAPPNEQSPCASVANVGDAEIQGFELEALWRPTRAVSVDFSYAYTDFEYTKIDPTTGVTIDSAAPFTPEHQASVGVQYRIDLGRWGDLTPRVDAAWQDEQYAAALNTRQALIPAYTLVNARLTWRSEDLKWELSLESTNLMDKYHYLTLYDLMATGGGYISGQPGRPREWALTIKRQWF